MFRIGICKRKICISPSARLHIIMLCERYLFNNVLERRAQQRMSLKVYFYLCSLMGTTRGHARTPVRDTKTRNTDATKSAYIDDVP